MAHILNLNKARKARAKAIAKAEAEANRARFAREKGYRASGYLERHKRSVSRVFCEHLQNDLGQQAV